MFKFKRISEIIGGTRLSTRDIGDTITNLDILDTLRHIPGAKKILNKITKAMFHNGFTQDIPKDRLLVIKKAVFWEFAFGFAAIVIKGQDLQAWNPRTNGIGFEMIEFDTMGQCTIIEIFVENTMQGIKVPRYDPATGFGFIMLRTQDGLEGPRGESKLLSLIDVLRIQHEIFLEYMKYAKKQGLAHKRVKIQDLDEYKYNLTRSRMKDAEKDDTVIIDAEDEFDYVSPQQNAYDPSSMMERADQYVMRESVLNKLHLSGDPGGIIATSETVNVAFYANIKEEQDFLLPQILDILIALGCTEDVRFKDPTETTIQMQMLGVLRIRQALQGLVKPEQIIEVINEYMGKEQDIKFELDPNYNKQEQVGKTQQAPELDKRSPNSAENPEPGKSKK